MKVAIVGSGISGLAAAWELSTWADVTVFESDNRLGGHTHTQRVAINGVDLAVDTGFIVFNERTYPGLITWLKALEIEPAPSDMSFSASLNNGELEWCGSSLSTVFAQRRNLASPRFWKMLIDIVRFNRDAPLHARRIRGGPEAQQSLGDYLDQHRYGSLFLDAYLLPMAGAIWSCPTEQMRRFPMTTFTQFCENHGLLSLNDRPQWMTIRGGAQTYIDRLQQKISSQKRSVVFRTGHAVQEVLAPRGGAGHNPDQRVVAGRIAHSSDSFAEPFDAVLLASHSDQSAQLVRGYLPALSQALQKIRYHNNTAYLHTDIALMPRRQQAWASWNYLHDNRGQHPNGVSVTYWMNRLQPLPVQTPVLVSLNPPSPPRADRIINVMNYAHPVFDGPASQAQESVKQMQGIGGVWLAGAWLRYGFHEDGFQSGVSAAQMIKQSLARQPNQSIYANAA